MAATDAPFVTLAGRGEAELRIRGSRFLGYAAPAETEETARELLTSLQRLHFDATHHCSAWRFRDGVWRAPDAGEPSGSAGWAPSFSIGRPPLQGRVPLDGARGAL